MMLIGFVAGVVVGFLGHVYRETIVGVASTLWSKLLRRS